MEYFDWSKPILNDEECSIELHSNEHMQCPNCESDRIILAYDYERDLKILKCRTCGEMFAVSKADVYNNGVSWVFSEWANSLASQRRSQRRLPQ